MFKYVWRCPDCGGSLNTANKCMECGRVYREGPTTATGTNTPPFYGLTVAEEQAIKHLKDLGYIVIKGGEIK